MKPKEVATVVAYLRANWPHGAMTEETVEIYRLELDSIAASFDEALRVLREIGGGREFAPSPMMLRDAILRARNPVVEWDEAYRVLAKAVSHGALPAPEFGHPVVRDENMSPERRADLIASGARIVPRDWMPEELTPEIVDYVKRRYGSWSECCASFLSPNGIDDHSITQAQVQEAHFRDEFRAITGRGHRDVTRDALGGPTPLGEILSDHADDDPETGHAEPIDEP